MNIQIIQVPYDSGHKGIRTGRGPEYFLQHGMEQIFRDDGHQVDAYRIESEAPLTTEIGTAFELNRRLAKQVRSAISSKMFPVVLAGNCNSCLGTLAGIGQNQVGIVWFDAHGDFNTPETTLSGFLDGMGLAMATGRCWRSLLGTIPGFRPVPEANVVHIGARDLDPEEERLLQQSEIEVVRPGREESSIHKAIDTALHQLRDKVTKVYLHVDMDVLDTGEALPNHLAVPGGLSVEVLEEMIGRIRERFEVCAGAITSFDPDYDKDDQVVEAGIRIVKAFVA
ncbi:MAG TPA: arginase family protein [Anaerolineales bacterium]|nr:arginase family protein [Anaerolineales bacterium]